MVSVIIPSYNRKVLTEKAVRSVLAQTYSDLEVIVVDDASREEEVFQCEVVHDPRVRLVRHSVNRGLAAARNTGVEAARGEIVSGLDSDDYWLEGKLESQMAIFDRLPDPDNVLIYSSYFWVEGGTRIIWPIDFLREEEPLSDYLFVRQGDIHGSNWLGCRELFQKFPSSTEMKRHQDWDMLLAMEEGGVRFVFCPTPAGVRVCDHAGDRLSAAPVKAMRDLFLERNLARMTPRAVVMWEALELGEGRKHSVNQAGWLSFLRRQQVQIGHILGTSRLSFAGRIGLFLDYTYNRIKNQLIERLRSRPVESFQDPP